MTSFAQQQHSCTLSRFAAGGGCPPLASRIRTRTGYLLGDTEFADHHSLRHAVAWRVVRERERAHLSDCDPTPLLDNGVARCPRGRAAGRCRRRSRVARGRSRGDSCPVRWCAGYRVCERSQGGRLAARAATRAPRRPRRGGEVNDPVASHRPFLSPRLPPTCQCHAHACKAPHVFCDQILMLWEKKREGKQANKKQRKRVPGTLHVN